MTREQAHQPNALNIT